MSSKKKTKDRAEESTVQTKQPQFLLDASVTQAAPRNNYLWTSNENAILSNGLYGAVQPADWERRRAWEAETVASADWQTRKALLMGWRADICRDAPAAALHPYHAVDISVRLDSPAAAASPEVLPPCGTHDDAAAGAARRGALLTAADMVSRIVRCYTALCNGSRNQDRADTPFRDYSVLLGRSVWVTGYDFEIVEKKDETFNLHGSTAAPTADTSVTEAADVGTAAQDTSEVPLSTGADVNSGGGELPGADECAADKAATADTTLMDDAAAEQSTLEDTACGTRPSVYSVHTTAGSTHILVCCGIGYYAVDVLDARRRAIRPVAELVQDLAAVHAHAQRQYEQLLALDGLSDAAKSDYLEGYFTVANLDALSETDSADLRRRLRGVSPVCAHSLEALASPLFTLVLAGAVGVQRPHPPFRAAWLRSCLALSVFGPGECSVRVPAAVVPMDTLKDFFLRVVRADASEDADTTVARGPYAPPDEKIGELSEVLRPGACHLPLWLPLTHRMALQPVPRPVPTPLWCPLASFASSSGGNPDAGRGAAAAPLELAQLCLGLVLATERALAASAAGAPPRPRVLVGLHGASGSPVPTYAVLYSSAVEEYIRVARGVSALLGSHTKAQLRAAALGSVRDLLHRCAAGLPTPGAPLPGDSVCGDVVITANLITQRFLRSTYGFARPAQAAAAAAEAPLLEVRACQSVLGASARVYVSTTVEEIAVRKQPAIELACVKEAQLGIVETDEEFAIRVRAALRGEIEEVRSTM